MDTKVLVLSFMNETGRRFSLRLSGIKDAITEAEVSLVMDTIIAKNIFQSSGGDLKVKDSAQIEDRTIAALSVR